MIDGLPKDSLKIIPDHLIHHARYDGVDYIHHDLREGPWDDYITCTMHRRENSSNLEVLKVALFCRRRKIKLTMLGSYNQFPLLALFADSVILQSIPEHLDEIYEDISDDEHPTVYHYPHIPRGMNVTDLIRDYGASILIRAMHEITDEDVVSEFAHMTIHVMGSAYEKYHDLKNKGWIKRNQIICEIKKHSTCSGKLLESIIRREGPDLPLILDRDWLKELCTLSEQHYMSVQCLASVLDGWSWVCYGGASNIFSFFPFKVICLADAYVLPEITKKLAIARWGENGFPLINGEQNAFYEMYDGMEDRVRKWTQDQPLVNENQAASSFSPQSSES